MNKKNIMTIALVGIIFLTGIFVIAIKYGIMAERSDKAEAQTIEWFNQFGTSENDTASGVALDSSGIYVCGDTEGILGPSSQGDNDAFIRKYDEDGNIITSFGTGGTVQFGTSDYEYSWGIAADSSGIYVVGRTDGALEQSFGKADAFIRKYDSDGNEGWTDQFGTSEDDQATDVSAGSSGIYVIGNTQGNLEGQSFGGIDAFIRKYDSDGIVDSFGTNGTVQFGTSDIDFALSVAVDPLGNYIYVVGVTHGDLGGPSSGGEDAFISKYDSDGNIVDSFGTNGTVQFGTSYNDVAMSISLDNSEIYVVGYTDGDLGPSSQGDTDAFIRKYDSDGNIVTSFGASGTVQFGTSDYDVAQDVSVDSSDVYVIGYTDGTLQGQASQGRKDAFIRKYDSDGNVVWTTQFGTSYNDVAQDVSIDPSGIYVAGLVQKVSPVDLDAFIAKILPKLTATIDIAPNQLVRKSKMKWITAYIELPEGYDVNDVDISSVKLNDTVNGVVAEPKPSSVGDHDLDGVPDLMVKFDKGEVTALIPSGDTSFIATITGLLDGTAFEGSDTIKVK